ncbi:MAG: hypothetical protein ACTSRZ_12205 [Promethearchaeota archaeon]
MNYISYVKNSLIKALLEALFDVLDADGVNSILKFANIEIDKDNLDPEGETPTEVFNSIIEAINTLLLYSNKVLYEVGRKFAFYIAPFGADLEEFYRIFEKNINDKLQIQIENKVENKLKIIVQNCPFCHGKLITSPTMNGAINLDCEFYKGFISETIKKGLAINSSFTIDQTEKSKSKCVFEVNYQIN